MNSTPKSPPKAVIVCPKCGAIQFALPPSLVKKTKSFDHLFAEISKGQKGWKGVGRCKVSGCNGYWRRKDWLFIKVMSQANVPNDVEEISSEE